MKVIDGGLSGRAVAPAYVPKAAQGEWNRVVADLAGQKLLTPAALGAVASYVIGTWTVSEFVKTIQRDGAFVLTKGNQPKPYPALGIMNKQQEMIARLAAELGLAPASRSRKGLSAPNEGGKPMRALQPAWLLDGSEIPDPYGCGQRAVDFLRALRHPQSATAGFDPPFFSERIIRRIYGPANAAGRRQVKTDFIMIPRGARKTTIGAGLALMHTVGHERVIGGQIIVALTEEQATFAAEEARTIAQRTLWLATAAKVTKCPSLIEHRKTGTALKTISSDGDPAGT